MQGPSNDPNRAVFVEQIFHVRLSPKLNFLFSLGKQTTLKIKLIMQVLVGDGDGDDDDVN